MTAEEAKRIQELIEKNAKIILKYLAEPTKNKSNKIFISGKTGKEIKYDKNLSPEEINAAVEYMEVNNWVKTIQDNNQDHQYKFIQVEVTNKGREVYKEWNTEKK